MPTASSPRDFIYSSALIIGKFIKAERFLRSVLIPALSETNIPTTHSFLQSPLQTFNCRMIQANLSSQISLYSQGRAVSPRVFQSTAIGCPVLDSMTVFFPNNSASHKKVMIQAAKIAWLLKNRKGNFVCYSQVFRLLLFSHNSNTFAVWSSFMWALGFWFWASCSKKSNCCSLTQAGNGDHVDSHQETPP